MKINLKTKQNKAYASANCDWSCQMRLNQAYIPINPERENLALPTTAVGEDEHVDQFYEHISLNEDSVPIRQLGTRCERNDKTYDYIFL